MRKKKLKLVLTVATLAAGNENEGMVAPMAGIWWTVL
jgi:hypothetical protein